MQSQDVQSNIWAKAQILLLLSH